jgi:hypothetical protein
VDVAPVTGPTRRAPRWPLIGLIALIVVAIVTAGVVILVEGLNSSRLVSALGYAPASAQEASFTDWDAYDHDAKAAPETAGIWVSYDNIIRDRVGVDFASADWELLSTGPDLRCDILQWPSADGPDKLAAALVKAGWTQSTEGGHTILGRDTLSDDEAFGWALGARYFGVDPGSHRTAQCVQQSTVSGALDGYDDSFAGVAEISALTSAAGDGVAVELRRGPNACIPSHELGSSGGQASAFTATVLALDSKAGTTGVVALAYPSGQAASADLDARKSAFARAQAREKLRTNDPYELRSIDTSGSVIVAHLESKQPLDRVAVTGDLGIDACNGNG